MQHLADVLIICGMGIEHGGDGVRDYMIAADAMCLSSKMEGMPMTIIEAFSVGLPALCTPVGGCSSKLSATARIVPPIRYAAELAVI